MSKSRLTKILLTMMVVISALWATGNQKKIGLKQAQHKKQEKILQQILDQAIDSNDIFGASFTVWNGDGDLLIEAAAGTMNLNTQYPLSNITEMFTGAILFNLQEKGLLKLDDKVYKYLGQEIMDRISVMDGIDYSREITIRHLLSHASGLPDYWTESKEGEKSYDEIRKEKDMSYSIQDLLTLVHDLKPHFRPGVDGKAYYSDVNYQLLGLVIEKVLGKPLADCYRTYIFNPLKLKATYLYEKGMKVDMAPVYYQKEPLKRPLFIASERSSAGLVSNLSDMRIFLKAYFSGTLFPKRYLTENQEWNPIQFPPMEYGMNLMKLGNMFGHSGAIGTVAYYIPESDLYLVGTTGQLDTQKTMMLTIQILQSLGYPFHM